MFDKPRGRHFFNRRRRMRKQHAARFSSNEKPKTRKQRQLVARQLSAIIDKQTIVSSTCKALVFRSCGRLPQSNEAARWRPTPSRPTRERVFAEIFPRPTLSSVPFAACAGNATSIFAAKMRLATDICRPERAATIWRQRQKDAGRQFSRGCVPGMQR